jgi:hypothetical protein
MMTASLRRRQEGEEKGVVEEEVLGGGRGSSDHARMQVSRFYVKY